MKQASKKEDTKQRILDEALRLFSQSGFDSVSVERIASAVGIKAPSLYKHFKSKQDIFNAIVAETYRRYDKFTDGIDVHVSESKADEKVFEQISEDMLVQKVQQLIGYSLHDEYVSRFRRMMTIEQFRNADFAEMYTERYVERLVRYHAGLFRALIATGTIIGEDPETLALEYVAPVILMVEICDRQPDKEKECMKRLELHVRNFFRTYSPQKVDLSEKRGDKNDG
ncbi:MAG: TetR/AcrR family transcriptional regulator [Ruminiclostridium sp.]